MMTLSFKKLKTLCMTIGIVWTDIGRKTAFFVAFGAEKLAIALFIIPRIMLSVNYNFVFNLKILERMIWVKIEDNTSRVLWLLGITPRYVGGWYLCAMAKGSCKSLGEGSQVVSRLYGIAPGTAINSCNHALKMGYAVVQRRGDADFYTGYLSGRAGAITVWDAVLLMRSLLNDSKLLERFESYR